LNAPSVLSHDCPHSVETETRSLPNALRRGKGIEDVGLYLRRNSWTVIADFNHDIAIFTENVDAEFSLTEHRFDGVLDKIGASLVQFIGHRIHKEGAPPHKPAAP
jgi:hypothetical protein